ncbi:trypsin-like peptidase domain-containing protein [Streptomyces sp. NPDC091279]|uniref:trypsin-like peptidase domain-containing protein n=1 Tax=Streptomyces sp. NPDC091279 TaxID=3365983 RepID=UPI003817478E
MDEGKRSRPPTRQPADHTDAGRPRAGEDDVRPPVPDAAPTDGDFVLRRPEETPAAEEHAGDLTTAAAPAKGTGAEAAGDADAVAALDGDRLKDRAVVPAPGGEPELLGAVGGPPAPLHAPDPYSTPPYGQPGPWAPAPPVQHPATPPPDGDVPLATPWETYDPWAGPAHGPLQQTGAAVDSTAQRRRKVRRALVGGAAALALVAGGLGGLVGAYLERHGVDDVVLPQAGKEAADRPADSVAGIAARALPSVVTLHVSGAEEAGTGTGFVLDDRGHILTNNHVVESAGSAGTVAVTFDSGHTAKATVVGRDSGYDLAVVQVSGVRGLRPLPLGNSDNVQVGDPVVAIGAPFDLAGTVTSGVISAKERPITAGGESGGSDISYVDALQTDAPINPGNSGGPLLDTRARVVGINSAIRSADGGGESESGSSGSIGLGFAIPVNQAKRVAEELINTGHATHPVIGVTLDMDYDGDGARVATRGNDGEPAVTTGGPGARAGVEPGDVVTEIDGRAVHTGEELIVKIRAHRPGDGLELTVVRDGKERAVTLVLGSSAEG